MFLGKRRDVQGIERTIDLAPSQKQCVLEPLAHYMMAQRVREINTTSAVDVVSEILRRVSPTTHPSEFLKMIESTSGLLLERENGEYGFAHKTFQEYLAAIHCRNQNLETDLTAHVNDQWWHETIRLYVAQSDATPILQACLHDDPPGGTALALAVECVDEAQQVDPHWRQRVWQILADELEKTGEAGEDGTSEVYQRRQRSYGEALLRLRLRSMTRLVDDRWVDTKAVTQAEYQVFLDEKRAIDQHLQPDHWNSFRFPAGHGGAPIAGIRGSDAAAFCNWLTDREGAWLYRIPRHLELPRVVDVGCEGAGCWAGVSPGSMGIDLLSSQEKETFMSKFTMTVQAMWASDVDDVNALMHCAKFTQYSSSYNHRHARVLPIILSFDVWRLMDYDRTIDGAREMSSYRSYHFEQAIEGALDRDLSDVLGRARDLELTLSGRQLSDFLDRGAPTNSTFARFLSETRQQFRKPWEDAPSSIRMFVNDMTRSADDPAGASEMLSFFSKIGPETGRDIDYARLALLPLVAQGMLARAYYGRNVWGQASRDEANRRSDLGRCSIYMSNWPA